MLKRSLSGGRIDRDAVSSADLGLIELGVGAPEQRLGIFASPQAGDAERGRDHADALTGAAQHPLLGLELGADIVDELSGVAKLRIRENDRKFLAAVPRRGVAALDIARQELAEQLQHHVADGMAEPVIDLLEMVEVGENQAHIAVLAMRLIDLLDEIGVDRKSTRLN